MRRHSYVWSVSKRRAKNKDDQIHLPEEIWLEILLRIPGKRVFKFRGLSKYFKRLIGSGEFIRRHYDVSIKTRPNLLLHHKIEREGRWKRSHFGRNRYIPLTELAVIHLDLESVGCKIDEFKPPSVIGNESRFLGCCRGILCYRVERRRDRPEHLIFWNPLTGIFRASASTSNDGPQEVFFYYRYFFGHDAVTDDFKVLRVRRSTHHCVIYTSNTNSWSSTQGFDHLSGEKLSIDDKMMYGETEAQVFVEGTNCSHMIASGNILAFDFGSENFNLVPLPKSCTKVKGLSSVDGCLCFYNGTKTAAGRLLNVWIMKEYGVEESWAHLLSFNLGDTFWPYGFAVYDGRPQLVLEDFGEKEKLYLYDVHQKQHTRCVPYLKHSSYAPEHFLYAPSCRKP